MHDTKIKLPDTVERHTLTVLVDNEAGVLARVAGLFSGRGYNIESLTVAEVDRKLTMDVAQLREAVRQLTQDLTAFRDPARLRARLGQYDLDDEPGELEAMQEMMEIATMLGDFRPPRRPRQR